MFARNDVTRRAMRNRDKLKVVYRLDCRPPSVVLKGGISGTNNRWMNNIFGEYTVFTAKSLRGISRFSLESLLNRPADGSMGTGELASSRKLYSTEKDCFVYKIIATGLDHIDVNADLHELIPSAGEFSRLYQFRKNEIDRELMGLQSEGVDTDIDDLYFSQLLRLNRYAYNVTKHTEEVILKGPIAPSRITLYQKL